MKKTTIAILLFSALAWVAEDPNPGEYAVNIHVSSSSTDLTAINCWK